MNHKGQLNSIDSIVSVVIFTIVLTFILTFWFVNIQDIDKTIDRNKLEYDIISISDLLLKSSGIPSNWEENYSSVQMMGLVDSQNVLNENKLSNFTSMNYTELKEALGTIYEIYFYIEDIDGNKLYETGNNTLEGQSISLARFAVLNGEPVKMRLVLHE